MFEHVTNRKKTRQYYLLRIEIEHQINPVFSVMDLTCYLLNKIKNSRLKFVGEGSGLFFSRKCFDNCRYYKLSILPNAHQVILYSGICKVLGSLLRRLMYSTFIKHQLLAKASEDLWSNTTSCTC